MLARSLTLKNGIKIPRLGQGTWFMGENISKRSIEIETLRRGVELGMTLIDSAEMYGDGAFFPPILLAWARRCGTLPLPALES